MQEDQFWLLVSLKLSGEATEQEMTELDALLQEYPEMGLRVDILRNIWQQKNSGISARKGDVLNKHLQRLSNHLSDPVMAYESDGSEDINAEGVDNEERSNGLVIPEKITGGTRRNLRWMLIASGAAAAIAAFFFISGQPLHIKTGRISAQNTISTKRGSKSKVQLPDGTEVWLNGDSRLTYDESFAGVSREVQLMGEAYFDVSRDKDHPFIIHTSSIDIKVLGTTLNVRSYCNEKRTEAALIRGSIEVTIRNSPDKRIILQPNEKLVVQNGKAAIINEPSHTPSKVARDDNEPMMVLGKVHFQKKDSVATEVLWVKNKLAFDGESLKDVVLKIERWYDVRVTITDESLKGMQYSGVFEDESLRQVMEALRMTGNFRYTINKKEVTIRP